MNKRQSSCYPELNLLEQLPIVYCRCFYYDYTVLACLSRVIDISRGIPYCVCVDITLFGCNCNLYCPCHFNMNHFK